MKTIYSPWGTPYHNYALWVLGIIAGSAVLEIYRWRGGVVRHGRLWSAMLLLSYSCLVYIQANQILRHIWYSSHGWTYPKTVSDIIAYVSQFLFFTASSAPFVILNALTLFTSASREAKVEDQAGAGS